MNAKHLGVALSVLVLASGTSIGTDPMRVELFKYEIDPQFRQDRRILERLEAQTILESHEVHAYALVLHLGAGERLVSAKAEVRGGFAVEPGRGRRRVARGVLQAMGFGILLREVPDELRNGLAILGEVALPGDGGATQPAPRIARRVKLRGSDVDQHERYATGVLVLAASSATRLVFDKIVVRSADESGKQRKRTSCARPVLVPGPTDPAISREQLVRILLDRGEE